MRPTRESENPEKTFVYCNPCISSCALPPGIIRVAMTVSGRKTEISSEPKHDGLVKSDSAYLADT